MLEEYIKSKVNDDPEKIQAVLDAVLRVVSIYPPEYLEALTDKSFANYVKSFDAGNIPTIFSKGESLRQNFASTGLYIQDEQMKPEFVDFKPQLMEQSMSPAELALLVWQYHDRYRKECEYTSSCELAFRRRLY